MLAENAIVTLPQLLIGTQDPIVVRAEKINQGLLGRVILRLTDVAGNVTVCEQGFNRPPTANAGPDQTVEWTTGGAVVTLDGSGSSDPDGDTLTYTWTGPFPESGGTVSGVSPAVTLPSLGPFDITLVVNDGTVDGEPDTLTITVVDTTAPVVTAALVPVGEGDDDDDLFRVEFSCSDTCDDNPAVTFATINGVPVSNGQLVELELEDDEEQEVGEEDGVLEIEAPSFLLTVECVDASGNVGTATATPPFPGKRRYCKRC